MKQARLAWRQSSADYTDVKPISSLEEQEVLAKPEIWTTIATMVNVEVPAGHPPSCLYTPSKEEDWVMGDLVIVEAEEEVEVELRLRELQGSCRAKEGKVMDCEPYAAGLAVELGDDVVAASLPDADNVASPRVSYLTR